MFKSVQSILIVKLLIIFVLHNYQCISQRTVWDTTFQKFYRPFRLWLSNTAVKNADSNRQYLEKHGKFQSAEMFETVNVKEICNNRDGPPRRSPQQPNSIHRLRPGDIDIIAAMGDSLTAGNGILATDIVSVFNENRGIAWSIGGQGDWKHFLTIPNILKVFNNNLYGYSLKDGLSTERSSKFNVAELGAMSRDMPYMAEILVKRLKRDHYVNMTHHWKLMTLLIGNNDFCSDVCFHSLPLKTIDYHEENMLKTYRYLRDNVPRLMLNVIPAPNLLLLTKLNHLPKICSFTLKWECPCIIRKSKNYQTMMGQLMDKWFERDIQIANRAEFNTDSFTINIQPFTKDFIYPTLKNRSTDISFASADCFHLSQTAQAAVTSVYWNNMLELPGEKSQFNPKALLKLKCPTKERPYLITRVNSQNHFII